MIKNQDTVIKKWNKNATFLACAKILKITREHSFRRAWTLEPGDVALTVSLAEYRAEKPDKIFRRKNIIVFTSLADVRIHRNVIKNKLNVLIDKRTSR